MLAALSTTTIVAIAIPVVVVLAGVFFAVAAVRSPRRGQGRLDAEAMRRDAAARKLQDARAAAEERAAAPGGPPATTGGTDVVGAGADEDGAATAVAVLEEAPIEEYAPQPPIPAEPIEVGITRRQALNRGVVVGSIVGLAAFGGASVAFLIPAPSKGFGAKVPVPTSLDDIKAKILSDKAPFYVPEAKTYLITYKASDEAAAETAYSEQDPNLWVGIQATSMQALYQKCPHLGCKVPWCQSSQWFECPCHGSQYNKAGEKKGGPAPRGMDRFVLTAANGQVTIDTGKVILGPPIGTDTISQQPEGPNCV